MKLGYIGIDQYVLKPAGRDQLFAAIRKCQEILGLERTISFKDAEQKRLIKELQLTPEAMQERFIKTIASVNKLIIQISEPGYGEKWQVSVQDGSVCFGSTFHNWALSLPYMQKKGITFKDVIDAYSKGLCAAITNS